MYILAISARAVKLIIVWVLCDKTEEYAIYFFERYLSILKLCYLCSIFAFNQLYFQTSMARDAGLEQDSDRSLAQRHWYVSNSYAYSPLYPSFVKNISVLCQSAYQLH